MLQKYFSALRVKALSYRISIFTHLKLWLASATHNFNPHNAGLISCESWKPKGFNQFESIINVLVSSFWFIWIPVLWVYEH